MLSKVVGLVLAAMLLKVFGSDKYDDAESEGEGEGGPLGGKGLTEASSSASKLLVGDHVDSRASEDRGVERSSSSECIEQFCPSPPLKEIVLRLEGTLLSFLVLGGVSNVGCGNGDDATRVAGFEPDDPTRDFPLTVLVAERVCLSGPPSRTLLLDLTVPANLRWNQLMIGLLDRPGSFLVCENGVCDWVGVGFSGCRLFPPDFGCDGWAAGWLGLGLAEAGVGTVVGCDMISRECAYNCSRPG